MKESKMVIPSEWNRKSYRAFQKDLWLLQDEKYKEFNFKTIFTEYEKIGIRMPILKSIAKKIAKGDAVSFLEVVEDVTYEEVMLEGLVVASLKDVTLALKYFSFYIQKIDNWALCDGVISSMKIVKNHLDIFFLEIQKYLKSDHEYIVRVGLVLLLDYYIDDCYIDEIFRLCNEIEMDTYYVNMALAWLISECFVKQKKKTIFFLKKNRLNTFTQNKAISKIRDSYRVSAEDKNLVLAFKRK